MPPVSMCCLAGAGIVAIVASMPRPDAASPARFSPAGGLLWYSTALPHHGNFTMACIQASSSGELELSTGCAATVQNLAARAQCVLSRPVLNSIVGRNGSGRRWIEAVQSSREGQRLLASRPLYKEHAYDLCNPATFGPTLKVNVTSIETFGGDGATLESDAANRTYPVELALAFSGEGLHGGRGRRHVQVHVELRHLSPSWRLLAFSRTLPTLSEGHLSIGMSARLVGPTIVAASPKGAPQQSRCHIKLLCPWCCRERLTFDFEYIAEDAGTYLFEVLLTHVLGQPVNHLALRTLAVVPQPPDNESRSASSRPCTHGHSVGRWMLLGAGAHGDELLDDRVGYNKGYRWTPFSCRYRRYTRLRFTQCLRRCRYRNIGFSGDSIGREQLTGLLQTLQGPNASIDGRAFKRQSNEMVLQPDNSSLTLRLLWNAAPPFAPNGGLDVFVCVPLIVTLLAEGMSIDRATGWLALRLVELRQKCSAHRLVCIYVTPPAVQRTPVLDAFSPGARYGHTLAMRNVTRHHVRAVSSILTKLARRLGFYLVDAYQITDARWFASWDGVHYLLSSRHADVAPSYAQLKYEWQGGVAHTVTTVLMNTLCNRCLVPQRNLR